MIRVDESDPVGEIEPAFPYRDVTVRKVNFKAHYDLQSEIGRGKFGTVYHCKEKISGLRLAAKIVNTTKKEDRRSVEREVEIMRRLQHPRLIQLYDAIDEGKQFYVVLELIEGGELFERVIDDDFVLTERSCAVFMRQICEGIEFVHAQNILHLDLKPENILCLTKEGNRIKIIDFGLARQFDPKKKLQVLFGTPEFVAPEVVNFDQIGYGTDMWSIGVICYVLLSGLSPFMGDTDVETMANVTIAKYDFDHEAFTDISEDAKDFIRCLLIKDKEKRASAAQCQSHRWLARRSPPKIEDTRETKTRDTVRSKKSKIEEKPPALDEARAELDVTKDNLRLFVERWREHPNSPYHLDDSSGSLETLHNVESSSLRGQSPSPRQSICSSGSEVSGSPRNNYLLNIPTLERRASDGNHTGASVRDPAAQIVLAEEIIRLSEHLRSMASGSVSGEEKTVGKTKVREKKTREKPADTAEVNEISEKLSTLKRQRKLNGTTFNGSRNYEKQESSLSTFTLRRSSLRRTEAVQSRDMFPRDWRSDETSQEIDLTPPWRKPRMKHRFGEICRDVPRISNLRDIHKSIDLDEPTSTKDLLLQLLGEWEERPGAHGRKSISVDWGEDSVARRSMNSLAEYFQSEQRKATKTAVSTTVFR